MYQDGSENKLHQGGYSDDYWLDDEPAYGGIADAVEPIIEALANQLNAIEAVDRLDGWPEFRSLDEALDNAYIHVRTAMYLLSDVASAADRRWWDARR